MFNLTSMTWRDLPDMPSEHGNLPGCGMARDRERNRSAIVVAGGRPTEQVRDVSILDLKTLTWKVGK